MPYKYCAGGCNSNYSTENEYVKFHRFPSDPEEKQKWMKEPKSQYETLLLVLSIGLSIIKLLLKKVTKFQLTLHSFFLYHVVLRPN